MRRASHRLLVLTLPLLLLPAPWLGCASSSSRDRGGWDDDGRTRRDPYQDPYFGHPGQYPPYPIRRGDHQHPLERHQDAEKRALERDQEREREALRREQKSERKEQKQAGEWDKADKREQKSERKDQSREQEQEDRQLKKQQRNEWEDWYDRRR
jgi:Spy/CpxP family protein refolding chaperone